MGSVDGEYTRDYDLSPAIVWDALVDPDLVDGWLAPADIDARPGGRYDLLLHPSNLSRFGAVGGATGTISRIEHRRLLEIRLGGARIRFELEELPFGTRGSSTRLRLMVREPDDSPFESDAWWKTSLEALEDLLRGHPVAWDTWPETYEATWRRFRDDAPGRATS